jgi:hypothetical protein
MHFLGFSPLLFSTIRFIASLRNFCFHTLIRYKNGIILKLCVTSGIGLLDMIYGNN